MIDCTTAREDMGLELDGELPPERRAALEEHLAACPSCRSERAELETLVSRLQSDALPPGDPPADMWNRIASRLEPTGRQRIFRLLRRPLAMAASLAILVGAGVAASVWLDHSAQVARADLVDYRLLLDGVAQDADAAVERFLRHYQAVLVEAAAIASGAGTLHFAIPPVLPGDYRLQQSYRIRIGNSDAYAATYRRASDGELVFTCFHKPVNRTLLGVHRESHCALAEGSHCVEAGPWQLIHFTDPTTCHCLLSRVTDEGLLREMLAAISPGLQPAPGAADDAATARN